jgi:hypothetical protein
MVNRSVSSYSDSPHSELAEDYVIRTKEVDQLETIFIFLACLHDYLFYCMILWVIQTLSVTDDKEDSSLYN